MPDIRSCKFYDPNDVEKKEPQLESAFERNRLRMMWFWKPWWNDIKEAPLTCVQEHRSDNEPVGHPRTIIFVRPTF